MKLKKLATALFSTLFTLSSVTVVSAQETVGDASENDGKGIVILHTNDAHCGIDADEDTFGYADLAAYRAKLEREGYKVIRFTDEEVLFDTDNMINKLKVSLNREI